MASEDPMDELWQAELQFLIEGARAAEERELQLRRIEDAYSIIERKADEVFERTGFYLPEMAEKMNGLRKLIEILRSKSV